MEGDRDEYWLLEDKGRLILLIDRLLSDLLRETAHLERVASAFDCREVPAISVLDYLKRTPTLRQVSASTVTAAVVCWWLRSSSSTGSRSDCNILL